MKAAVLVETGKPLVIEDVIISKPGPHEVLIRTAACGLPHWSGRENKSPAASIRFHSAGQVKYCL